MISLYIVSGEKWGIYVDENIPQTSVSIMSPYNNQIEIRAKRSLRDCDTTVLIKVEITSEVQQQNDKMNTLN